jgi:hypothetical protein
VEGFYIELIQIKYHLQVTYDIYRCRYGKAEASSTGLIGYTWLTSDRKLTNKLLIEKSTSTINL